MEPWVKKYAPKITSEIVGQEEVAAKLLKYVAAYKPGGKAILLAGPAGIGKTSLVHAIAQETDRELLEVNASDSRNKAAIESLIGPALKQRSLFFREKLILLDEIDGLSGNSDRGGATTLAKIIEESGHPLILTANDAQADKLKELRKKSTIVDIRPPSTQAITGHLRRIADAERIQVDDAQLSAIANRSGGDVRAAVTDLQTLSSGGKISSEDLDDLGDREHVEALTNALLRIFKTTSAELALPALDNVAEQPDEILLWIEENLPREYKKPEDLARAFDALAEADRFFGRIRRWQYYRFYVYIFNLLSAGVAIAKDQKYPGAPAFKRTERPLKIWIYNNKNAKRKRLAEQLVPHVHTSRRRVEKDILPYLKHIARSDPKQIDAIAQTYELGDEEVAWLTK